MSSIEVSENVRRRRATVNLSRSLGCHRSTYNRTWNKTKAAFMKKYHFLSFIEFATESTLKGPVILEKTLPQPFYLNFRRLALSMYLLAHPKLHKSVLETAEKDLLNFPNEYEWCYGCENLVYNVHSLQHLPDDVRAHGPLDSFSAFPFESYMRQIKDSVRSGFAVAKQAAQRYAERIASMKRKQEYLYNSVDMDVAEMQAGNTHVQYPKFSSTQLETSPSTSASKRVHGASADQLHAMVQNISSTMNDFRQTLLHMSTAISDLTVNVKQLLSKSNERERPHQFDCGLSSQQFPLSSEEELQMLDSGLSQKDTRDRFIAIVTRLSSDDPKKSMRFVLSYILTPELASALTHRFLSSSLNGKDLCKLYDAAAQGYFHDIRDKMMKRNRRKQDQINSNNNELAIALDMHNNRCLSVCSTVVQ
ncbi:unnamed protein product [Schistosoma mattheei]|uniref:Uncharacterized protein n=1 Tax=Schistosoma mattheei TaxID=31246 RepID=A0A183P738_9TREM|nr:unnamed protein product [Schistosoma mattheei]